MRKSFGHYNTAPKKEYLYEKKCIRSGDRSLGESADQELERKGPGSEPHLRHLPSTIVDKRPPSARVSALLVTEQGCGKHFARAEAVRMCATHTTENICPCVSTATPLCPGSGHSLPSGQTVRDRMKRETSVFAEGRKATFWSSK